MKINVNMRFMRILEEVKKLPETLYHVTPEENVKEILANGLLPTKTQSKSEGVYLSDDEFTAANYAHMRPDNEHVLLKIDSSFLDKDKLGPDDYELENFLDQNEWEVEGQTYYSVYDLSWKQSLKYVNQVVYYGKIPPEAIEIIEDSKWLS